MMINTIKRDESARSEASLPDKVPTLRVVPMPSDANVNGDIFGGWVMSQVDIAGSIPAYEVAKGRLATVAVNSLQFKQPIFVGDVVSFYAEVTKIGRTSISVHVEVYSQRRYPSQGAFKVTEADLTYVAIDEKGEKRVIKTSTKPHT
jgi:acyl-CoA thioesterase YciA